MTSNNSISVKILVVSLILAHFCIASELQFDNLTVDITVEPGAKTTEIIFPFSNPSEETVEIEKHQAPCTCISANFKDGQKIYKPGDKGEMVASFNVGNLQGTVKKQIVVWIKDAPKEASPIVLTANITIPEIVTITPRSKIWNTGEKPKPQTYKIAITHGQSVQITEVVTTNNHFEHALKTIQVGKEYELIVTPKNTKETTFGILKITTDSPISRYRRLTAFAAVKPK